MPQSNADPATPHPSYFTTGHHRPPHGLRVICLKNPPKPDKYRKIHTRSFSGYDVTGLNNPPKADKYRKIHTRSFSGYDQQLPNNLGEEERTRPQTHTPQRGSQQKSPSRHRSTSSPEPCSCLHLAPIYRSLSLPARPHHAPSVQAAQISAICSSL